MKKVLYAFIGLFVLAGPGASEIFPDSALKPLEDSVTIRQEAQLRQDDWDAEQQELADKLQQLSAESDRLTAEEKALEDRLSVLVQDVSDLEAEKEEVAQMAVQLTPSLRKAFTELKKLNDGSLPFDRAVREMRLSDLESVLDDPQVGVEEKFRQVFQAMLAEAQYGGSTEVTRELIQLDGREIMADVLRLGRLSLFFQTLDQSSSGFFNPVTQTWTTGPKAFDSDISHAVDIATKRRPADIVLLPLGKVVVP